MFTIRARLSEGDDPIKEFIAEEAGLSETTTL
jgi:hypothetical protein